MTHITPSFAPVMVTALIVYCNAYITVQEAI